MIFDIDGKSVFAATGGLDGEIDLTKTPSMVLVHGAGMDSSVWALQTRYLAHRARRSGLGPVLAIDLPGHGRSDGPGMESIADYAGWLAGFLSHIGDGDMNGGGRGGAPRTIVVGHSMGTFIALELAATHPEHVGSLVLVATAASMPVHPDLLAAAAQDLALAGGLMSGWGLAAATKVAPHPNPGMTMAAGTQALVERSAPDVLAADLSACAAYDALAAASAITSDVTVVSGRHDKMTPARSAAPLIDAFSADVHVAQHVFDCGHMSMTEAATPLRTVLAETLMSAADA